MTSTRRLIRLCWLVVVGGCGRPLPSEEPVVRARPAAAVAPAEKIAPRSRSWRLAPNSPFYLVAEGLRDATLITLGPHQVLRTAACGGGGQGLSLRLVQGDTFGAPPLPDVSMVTRAGGTATTEAIAGSWPENLLVLLQHGHRPQDASRRESALLQWNGNRWSELNLPRAVALPAEYLPYALLPWQDGAVLVAQSRGGSRYGATVEPFYVVGKTSSPPPDFSSLAFPSEPSNIPSNHVEYGVLTTGETFVLHHALFQRVRRTVVSLARSTAAGALTLETVIDVPHSVEWQFVTGQVDSKSVLLVFGLETLGQTYQPWLRMYDATSEIELGAAARLSPGRSPVRFRLAGGKVWLRRDDAMFRFDPTGWKLHAKLALSAPVSSVAGSAAFWANEQGKPSFFDEAGTRHDVPWLVGEGQPLVSEIISTGTDDVWLTATASDGESLVFRTRAMKGLLTCTP